jgi:hypothetical protein
MERIKAVDRIQGDRIPREKVVASMHMNLLNHRTFDNSPSGTPDSARCG